MSLPEEITEVKNYESSNQEVIPLEEAKRLGLKGEKIMVETDADEDGEKEESEMEVDTDVEKEKKEGEEEEEEGEEVEKVEEEKVEKKEEEEFEEVDAGVFNEYKKKAIGYDTLMADYTRKSMRLAEIEREKEQGREIKSVKTEVLSDEFIKKIAEENNFDEEATKASVKLIKTLLPHLGLIDDGKLEEREYEREKKYQIDLFLEKHPEYKPENDADASKWQKLNNYFFDTYQLPKDAKKIASRLAKAHEDLYPKQAKQTDPNADIAKTMIRIRKAKMSGAGSGGGSGQKETISKNVSLTATQVERLKDDGWSDKDIVEMYGI